MMNLEKDFYAKDFAIGFCDIRTDKWHYRFRDETFELDSRDGYTTFYEHGYPVMNVNHLRALAKREP